MSKSVAKKDTSIVENKDSKKEYTGEVISAKMNKTLVVQVVSVKSHPLYKKRYTSLKKYYVHDENNSANVGDKVNFVETKPMSKTKRWALVENK